MKEKLLINEINRISQIMGQNHNTILIIESLTSKTPNVREIAEKIKFYKAESELVKAVERFIGKSSKSFEINTDLSGIKVITNKFGDVKYMKEEQALVLHEIINKYDVRWV